MRKIEEDVLEALKARTKDNPLLRSDLKVIVGSRDSNARGVIQSLRSQGYRVCSSAGHKGYWLAESDGDYNAFRTELMSKANTIYENIKAMDTYLPDQIKMREI